MSSPDSASSANTARRPPASANPASAHFLAKPHFHPNVTFGDFTGTHPRARIGFRREFLPGTSEVRRTNHNHFLRCISAQPTFLSACRFLGRTDSFHSVSSAELCLAHHRFFLSKSFHAASLTLSFRALAQKFKVPLGQKPVK